MSDSNEFFQQMPGSSVPDPVSGVGTVPVQDTAGSPLPGAAVGVVPAPDMVTGTPVQPMSVTRRLTEPLWRAKGWMKFMGVLFIINGVFCILGIWTIVVCWLPIWMGLVLISGSNHIRNAAVMDSEADLKVSLDKIGLFFKIWGIVTLISMVLVIVFMVIWAVAGAAMMTSFMSQQAFVQ